MKTRSRALVGFTLIELLVVITIIAILAGLVLSTMGYANRTGAKKRAEGEIAALSAALESYYVDNGTYPTGEIGNPSSNKAPTGTDVLYKALQPTSGKVYFEFPKGMTNSSNAVVDPFGEQYGYVFRAPDTNGSNGGGIMNGSRFFDLWSRAGTTNSNDWVKNW